MLTCARMKRAVQQHHPANERIKRRYLAYLEEARGFSEHSLDQAAAALHRYEDFTGYRDFREFHVELARAFKQHLHGQKNQRTGDPLSQATVYSVLNALKVFFLWLAGQPGFRSRLSRGNWDYFSPSGATASIAKAHRRSHAPTLEQIRHVLQLMPTQTEIDRRNRALISLAILTGARDRALKSLQLRHVDLPGRLILQDSRVVETKFRKDMVTCFFPVGSVFEDAVDDWVRFLTEKMLWGPDDPLFPATRVAIGLSGAFGPAGVERRPWSTAAPIRKIFRRAFESAGFPYPKPHSFRNTLVSIGRETCETWSEMQAWAQNLGHESLTTTFGSYGKVPDHEIGKLVRNAGRSASAEERKIDRILEMVERMQSASSTGVVAGREAGFPVQPADGDVGK